MNFKPWHLIFPLFFLSSCFEFVEEVSFDGEESGTCVYTLNCSESKLKIKNLMSLDTFMNINIPSEYEVRIAMERISKNLSECKGITKVSCNHNFEKYIFSLQFHFDSISHLNDAINHVVSIENQSAKNTIPYHTIYQKDGGEFKRLQLPNDSLSKKIQKKHINLFEGATITSIFRFQSTVDNVSNSASIISKNKKAVLLKQDIQDLGKNPALQNNTIKLK